MPSAGVSRAASLSPRSSSAGVAPARPSPSIPAARSTGERNSVLQRRVAGHHREHDQVADQATPRGQGASSHADRVRVRANNPITPPSPALAAGRPRPQDAVACDRASLSAARAAASPSGVRRYGAGEAGLPAARPPSTPRAVHDQPSEPAPDTESRTATRQRIRSLGGRALASGRANLLVVAESDARTRRSR